MPKRKTPDFDKEEYYKLLAELFPSKYITEKCEDLALTKNNLNVENTIENTITSTDSIVNSSISDLSIVDSYISNMREQLNYIMNSPSINKDRTKPLIVLHTLLNHFPLQIKKINKELCKYSNLIEDILEDKTTENSKKYKCLLALNTVDDENYFKHIKLDDQDLILNKLKLLHSEEYNEKPFMIKLLESKMPDKFKLIGINKINQIKSMDKGESNKLVKWVESFLKLPFNNVKALPVTIDDGIEKCQEYMCKCESILNECVYGMNEVKGQIMQLIGKWITNPESMGTSIGLKGPMGTGKTTLVKYGISKLLNREFAFVTLGGSVDGAILKGHSYTYEGSSYGKIADILIQCKTNNPIIFFDELDKISQSDKGQEINGVLTHLTDTTQNNQFQDNYFSEIDLDLSKCLFVFSYNDEELVNPILKDRMYTIEIPGYNITDKIIIAEKYLIPAIEKDIGFEKGQIIFKNYYIKYLIEQTKTEEGVRNLKRNLETIYNKINLFRILKNTTLFKTLINVTLPFTIDDKIINSLIKITDKTKYNFNSNLMYI
jgi:ATP-dependent Lon protease